MYNSKAPTQAELPSAAKLVKSTIIAASAAAIILVTVVLPAEYGIDPTGIGSVVGLKKMGEIKTSLAQEAAAERAAEQAAAEQAAAEQITQPEPTPQATANNIPEETQAPEPAPTTLSHEKIVTLAPDEWAEIKLVMEKGSKANYVWWTDAGRANFDTHADSKALKIEYHSYAKGSKERDEGILEAEFTGSHGWFWRNRTSQTMTITLQTDGQYQDITLMR